MPGKSGFKPRKGKGKGKGKKGKAKRSGRGRSGLIDFASLSTKRSLAAAGGANFALGVLYSNMTTTLADYPRAVQVAQAYQFYRIKLITMTFKPSYDSFVSAAGASAKPRLYWMIDKAGAIPTNVTLEGLKAMGARPLEMDENVKVVSWAPSVLEAALDAPNTVASKYRISPWLATTRLPIQPGLFVPNNIDHLGVYWFLDAINNPEGYQYQVEIEVQFEFKKPLAPGLSSVHAQPAQLAQLNTSPDGIVGGHDDHLAT